MIELTKQVRELTQKEQRQTQGGGIYYDEIEWEVQSRTAPAISAEETNSNYILGDNT